MSRFLGPYDPNVLLLSQGLSTYYDNDYDEQIGGLLPDVFVEYDQSGKGWGAILRGIGRFFRPVVPFVKSGARAALGALAKQGAASAGEYVGDLVSGRNWRQAGAERIDEAAQNLGTQLQNRLQRMQGSGQIGGNKALHNAVKLFSYVPTTGRTGCVTRRRRRGRVVRKNTVVGKTQRRRRRRKVAAKTTGRRRKRVTRKKKAPRRRNQRGGGEFWL